jgi:hypothetical protein
MDVKEMPRLSEVSHVEVGYDPEFEKHWWIVMQVIWTVLSLGMIVGVIGWFGRGPAAKAEVQSGPLIIHYDKLLRYKTPSQLRIEASGPASGTLRIELSGSCARKGQVSRVMPQPASSQPLDPGAIYDFPGVGSGNRTEVTISLEPGGIGPASCRVATGDGAAVNLHQFIFP